MEALAHGIREIFLAQGSDLNPVLVIPRTIIVFTVAIVYVRFAKKRFIAQASALDLVIAVMFGSLLSRAINGGATLLSSLVAGFILVVLQRICAHFSCRSQRFAGWVKGSSQVIVRNGQMDIAEMRKHDISEDDLLSEMRTNALTDRLADVEVAIFERSGHIGIVKKVDAIQRETSLK